MLVTLWDIYIYLYLGNHFLYHKTYCRFVNKKCFRKKIKSFKVCFFMVHRYPLPNTSLLPRYIAMAKLQKERDEILTRHVTEALYPPTDNWGPRCLGKAINAQRASKPYKNSQDSFFPPALRWQLKPDSETLNIVLLGADDLSHDLANEITVCSIKYPISWKTFLLDPIFLEFCW